MEGIYERANNTTWTDTGDDIFYVPPGHKYIPWSSLSNWFVKKIRGCIKAN